MFVLCMAMLAVGQTGCRGYNLGNQQLFRPDIRSVHVPIFESDSFRQTVGQQLTEATIKEIELSTPLTISDPALANSFLQGRIVRERKRVNGENISDDPRSLQVEYRVEVTWVDRAGTPLMQRQSVRIDNDVDFIPEGGQSITTAQYELFRRIARQIVGQMETRW